MQNKFLFHTGFYFSILLFSFINLHSMSLSEPENAAYEGNFSVVKNFVDKGADKNILNRLLILAVQGKQEDIFKYLLNLKNIDLKVRSNSGQNLVIWSTFWGSIELMKELIWAGVDVDAEDNNGNNALLWTATYLDKERFQVLAACGANINKLKLFHRHKKYFEFGKNIQALFKAVKENNFSEFSRLRKIEIYYDMQKLRIPLNLQDQKRNNLLHYAVIFSNKEMIVTLLAYDSELIVSKNSDGHNPVDLAFCKFAAEKDTRKVFVFLLNLAFI